MLGCGQRLGKSVSGVFRARQNVLIAVHPDKFDRFCRRVLLKRDAHFDRAPLCSAVYFPFDAFFPAHADVGPDAGVIPFGVVFSVTCAVNGTLFDRLPFTTCIEDLAARLVAAAVVVDVDAHSAAHHLVGHRRTDGIVEFRALFVIRIVGFKRCDGHEHRYTGHAEVVIIAGLCRIAPAVEGLEGKEIPDPLVLHGLPRRGLDPLGLVERKAHAEHHRERQRKSNDAFHAAPSSQLTQMLAALSLPS